MEDAAFSPFAAREEGKKPVLSSLFGRFLGRVVRREPLSASRMRAKEVRVYCVVRSRVESNPIPPPHSSMRRVRVRDISSCSSSSPASFRARHCDNVVIFLCRLLKARVFFSYTANKANSKRCMASCDKLDESKKKSPMVLF